MRLQLFNTGDLFTHLYRLEKVRLLQKKREGISAGKINAELVHMGT